VNTATKIAFFIFAMALSFYAGKEIESNKIYGTLEAANKSNPIEVVRVCAESKKPDGKPKHKRRNPKLIPKGD